MRPPSLTSYTTLDLLLWSQDGSLELSPKFQRRSVWSPAAKSYFIDSLIRGFPIPPIHIRVTHAKGNNRVIRDVVDGQQRLRAVFDFIAGKYALSNQLAAPWAGKTFDALTEGERDNLRLYVFNVYQYDNAEDELILEIFARMNSYSVRANEQELRHGRFFGEFKQSVYALAPEFLPWWRQSRLFTETGIARMQEAELVGELLVAQLDGLQDKKASLNSYYAQLEDSWTSEEARWPWRSRQVPSHWMSREETETRFRAVTHLIIENLGQTVAESPFRRRPLYYTLHTALYHRIYLLPRLNVPTPRKRMSATNWRNLRTALESLSPLFESDVNAEELRTWQRTFLLASLRQTDNIAPREERLRTLWRVASLDDA